MSRNSPRPRSRGTTPDPFVEEFSRMLITRDAEFRAKLDQTVEEKARIHQAALDEAERRHEEVREQAHQTLEASLRLKQHERDEASRQLRARHEEQARRLELEATNRRLEEERKKAEQEREIQEKAKQANLLAEKNAAAEEARRAAPAPLTNFGSAPAQNSQRQQQPETPIRHPPPQQTQQQPIQHVQPVPQRQSQPAVPTPSAPFQASKQPSLQASNMVPSTFHGSGLTTTTSQKDAIQRTYLDLHKRLKELRASLRRAGPAAAQWTNKRRELDKMVGQVALDTASSLSEPEKLAVRKANSQKRSAMLGILSQAKGAPGPLVDARDYLIASKSKYVHLAPDAAQVPSVFIYLLNFFAKICIKKMKESASQPDTNLTGVTVAFIFGHNDLRWNGESFVDIFLAKYHKVCPVLFGIYGPENTREGRDRLGWATSKGDEDDHTEDTYVAEAFHRDDMMGLAMGWSAVTLRDFKTTKTAQNSLPPWHFWQSVACIVNVPPKEVTETHLIVLKNILEHYADKFVKFYGQAATVALRKAVVEFPASLPNSTAASGVKLLRELFQKQYGIRL